MSGTQFPRKALEEWALVFARGQVDDFEFLSLEESEELEGMSDGSKHRLYDLIKTAKVTLSWPDA